jgi:cytidylate kinase
MADLIITIDGPAGSGKSTMARLLAERLGATFLDTGAMYRAITLVAVRDGADLGDERQLLDVVQRHRFDFEAANGKMLVRIDGEDVTELIRDPDLTAKVRHIAAAPAVREQLVAMQRAFAARHEKIVTEGRDQGTVAFPDARIKLFLTADPADRARRRAEELQAKGADADFEQIRRAIDARDKSDENRAVGPLKPAKDAIRIDSSGLSIEEAGERIYRCVKERLDATSGAPADPPSHNPGPGSAAHVSHSSREPQASRSAVDRVKAAWYWFARFMCQAFCTLFFRYRSYGRENLPRTGSFILASNHQSFLDPVFCGIAVKRHLTYVARDTLFRNWFFGPLIASVNAIPIGRDRADIAAMRLVIDRLRQGGAVCLFPEGTRTDDGRVIPVKPGFGLLCRRSKATVVPVLIDGAFELWPRHRKLFSPGSIVVRFGTPMSPEQIARMTNEELADTLTRTLRRMQHEVRLQGGRPPYDYEAPMAPEPQPSSPA